MPYPDWLELPARQREMLKLYAEGFVYRQIAEKTSYSIAPVGNRIRAHLTPEVRVLHQRNYKGGKKGLSRNARLVGQEAEICRLYAEEGMLQVEIAQQYEVRRQAIAYRLEPFLTADLRARHRRVRREKRLGPLLPKFRELTQSGVSCGEIMATLGIGSPTLALLMDSLDGASRFRLRSAQISHKPRFSPEEKMVALREAAKLNGGRIGFKSYERLRKTHPDWPCAQLMATTGGWNYWLTRAGLPTNPRPAGTGLQTFSDGDCRVAVAYVYKQLGRLYSEGEYDQKRRANDPSAALLRKRFSKGHKWVAAIEKLLPSLFDSIAA